MGLYSRNPLQGQANSRTVHLLTYSKGLLRTSGAYGNSHHLAQVSTLRREWASFEHKGVINLTFLGSTSTKIIVIIGGLFFFFSPRSIFETVEACDILEA